jgi:predicted nucleic acid-binding protein
MNIIIDSNIFIAALLKNGKIRDLIVNSSFDLLLPEVIYEEIREHKQELIEKSGLNENEFNSLSQIISQYVKIVPSIIAKPYKKQAEEIIKNVDEDDIPFIATSLACNSCPIWTDDTDFKKQNKIRVITTKEMIEKEELN